MYLRGDLMLNYVDITKNQVTRWPKHFHSNWEIMHYAHGNGYLYTSNDRYPFKPGTIIIMPPNIEHSTVGESEYSCISFRGNFKQLLNFTLPTVLNDNDAQEGTLLIQMIYNNRFDNTGFLLSLHDAYLYFLLKNYNADTPSNRIVNKIILEITQNADNSEFNVVTALRKSGYAEDYIRSLFKRNTGMTPTEFLSSVRIQKARQMIDIWGDKLTISQIAETCGFTDPVYFSKRFKSQIGLSPHNYLKSNKKIL